MRRAIYTPQGFPPFWVPEPVEVEFLGWEGHLARVRVPFSADSLGAMVARNAGHPHPGPWERLVPAGSVRLIEAEG